jgi:hypothetical protein
MPSLERLAGNTAAPVNETAVTSLIVLHYLSGIPEGVTIL